MSRLTPAQQSLRWLNWHRRQRGLAPVHMDPQLSQVSAERARHLAIDSTRSPHGGRPGENWAIAPDTFHAQAQFVSNATTQANQLRATHTRVGISVISRGADCIVVQQFA